MKALAWMWLLALGTAGALGMVSWATNDPADFLSFLRAGRVRVSHRWSGLHYGLRVGTGVPMTTLGFILLAVAGFAISAFVVGLMFGDP